MIGAVLADRYRLDAALARGGMGAVYRATDLRLRREVAVKLLLPELSADLDAIERFQNEGLAAARLSHPGIVAILDIGSAPDPGGRGRVSYIVMELVPGRSLASVVAEGPLPVARAIDVGVQLLEALGAAHAAGITHRDLKPANVMVVPAPEGERVKLVDFGLAQIKSGTVHTRLTQTGQILGTPLYLSPEQARAEPCDARTDVYAVGLILWSCLTGRVPYSGRDMASVIASVLEEVPAPLDTIVAQVPPHLARAVARALSKPPGDRFSSAAEFAQALRPAASTALPSVSPLREGRGPWAVAAVAVLAASFAMTVAGAALVIAWLGWSATEERPPVSIAEPPLPVATLTLDAGALDDAHPPAPIDESLVESPRPVDGPRGVRSHRTHHEEGSPRASGSTTPVSPPPAPPEPPVPPATTEPAAEPGAVSGPRDALCRTAVRCCVLMGGTNENCWHAIQRDTDQRQTCTQVIISYRGVLERQGRDASECHLP